MNLEEIQIAEIIEKLSSLYKSKNYSEIKKILTEFNPADIAVFFFFFSI